MEDTGLSPRGAANVAAIWPRISSAVAERERKDESPLIDMGTSENWLIRDELIEIYKRAIHRGLCHQYLSYPNGFAGDQGLLNALAQFFNSYFKPHIPVMKEHLATAPGAAFALDALLYNICEPGDGLLVPGPFWNGFDWLLSVRSGVQPILVAVESFADVFTQNLIPALERGLANSPRPVKGVLFTNPQNPLGQCYPADVITEVIKFCNKKGIHFISDEIYAMSSFHNPEMTAPVPFASALEFDIQGMGCDISRVHTIWSISKDLGSSGLRMGCCITQGNRPLATGMSLASNTQMSSLTAIAVTALLRSPELPRLFALNSERLAEAYARIISMLKKRGLQYIPANTGPFIFVQLAPHAQMWDEEAEVIQACKMAGVSVSTGRDYHVPEKEKGWARLNFALQPNDLTEALHRLAVGLDQSLKQRSITKT